MTKKKPAAPATTRATMSGDEFKALRIKLGLTQQLAADVLGYGSNVRVAEIEGGRKNVTPHLERLMRAYEAGYRPDDWPHEKIAEMAGVPEQRAAVAAKRKEAA